MHQMDPAHAAQRGQRQHIQVDQQVYAAILGQQAGDTVTQYSEHQHRHDGFDIQKQGQKGQSQNIAAKAYQTGDDTGEK